MLLSQLFSNMQQTPNDEAQLPLEVPLERKIFIIVPPASLSPVGGAL